MDGQMDRDLGRLELAIAYCANGLNNADPMVRTLCIQSLNDTQLVLMLMRNTHGNEHFDSKTVD